MTSDLYRDLGVYGDDANELFAKFKDTFDVDMTGCQLERHFPAEGGFEWFWIWLRKTDDTLVPATIDDLVTVARMKKWRI
jgi:hypothetical protein